MNYIVEKSDKSNSRIMKKNSDGTYSAIAFSAGDSNLSSVIELVNRANIEMTGQNNDL